MASAFRLAKARLRSLSQPRNPTAFACSMASSARASCSGLGRDQARASKLGVRDLRVSQELPLQWLSSPTKRRLTPLCLFLEGDLGDVATRALAMHSCSFRRSSVGSLFETSSSGAADRSLV